MLREQSYTLERLSHKYEEADIEVKSSKDIVSDEEVSVFLNAEHKVWPFTFYIFFFLIALFITLGLIDG